MKYLKLRHSIELAEYGNYKGNNYSKAKSRTEKRSHKYGHIIPNNVAEALKLMLLKRK